MGLDNRSGSRCTPAKVKSCLKTFLVHLFSHVGLCVLVVGYAAAGGFIFQKLEYRTDEDWKVEAKEAELKLNETRQVHVTNLWIITDRLNVLYEKNWTVEVEAELERFERAVKVHKNDHGVRIQWTFTSALLYSVSIITTIGYGHIFPKTMGGKLFTMLYAVLGVPIMLLWVSNIGNVMAHAFKFAYFHGPCYCGTSTNNKKTVQKRFHAKEPTKNEPPDDHRSSQVEFSLNSNKFETVLLEKQTESPSLSYPRSPPSFKRDQVSRRSLQNLDHTARQILFECAEYNLSHGDEPSRELMEHLCLNPFDPDDVDRSSKRSSDIESVIDLGPGGQGRISEPTMIPPPPTFDESGSVIEKGRGRNGSNGRESLQVYGTPSRVPLLADLDVLDIDIERVDTGMDERVQKRVPVVLVLLVVVLYIVLGAAVFTVQEDWNFWDSAYFCFITLSTIGLGDMTPGKSLQPSGTRGSTVHLVFCCFYLVIGLAIIAMSFNLVQEQVTLKVTEFAKRIGIIENDL